MPFKTRSPCLHNPESSNLYIKSAAATQNHRSNQKVTIVGDDGEPKFNERLSYCTDCTEAKRAQMLTLGRCNPFHLSDKLDGPDSPVGPTVRLGSSAETPPLAPGDAFAGLVGYQMLMGQRQIAWERV